MNQETTPQCKRTWTDRGSPVDQANTDSPDLKQSRKMPTMEEIEAKIDMILKRTESLEIMEVNVRKNTATIGELKSDYEGVQNELVQVRKENRHLRDLVSCIDGRLQRSEREIEKLKGATVDLTYRSMKPNMVIFNAEEKDKENCKKVAYAFLCNKMLIENERLTSDIVIDVAHRLGEGEKPRPLVVRFTTHHGKASAMTYCPNLKGTPYYVKDQLPIVMNDKAVAQIPKMKELKLVEGNKVSLVRDTLYNNRSQVDTEFSKNTIPLDINNISRDVSLFDIAHGDLISINGTDMQAHAFMSSDPIVVKSVLAKIRADPVVAKADHILYAYIAKNPQTGTCIKGFDDDYEFGVSKHLLAILEKNNMEGILIVNKHNGPRRLKNRKEEICKVAETMLNKMEY